MTITEFITRANHSAPFASHAEHYQRMHSWQRSRGMRHGYYRDCAPLGARTAYPIGLPVHGPSICARGAYAS